MQIPAQEKQSEMRKLLVITYTYCKFMVVKVEYKIYPWLLKVFNAYFLNVFIFHLTCKICSWFQLRQHVLFTKSK